MAIVVVVFLESFWLNIAQIKESKFFFPIVLVLFSGINVNFHISLSLSHTQHWTTMAIMIVVFSKSFYLNIAQIKESNFFFPIMLGLFSGINISLLHSKRDQIDYALEKKCYYNNQPLDYHSTYG